MSYQARSLYDEASTWVPPQLDGGVGAVASVLIVATLLHLALRALDRARIINYCGRGFRRGLSGAAIALNAIFQPHARDPDLEQKLEMRCDRADEGDGPMVPPFVDPWRSGALPDDGLRGPPRSRKPPHRPVRTSPSRPTR